MGYTVEHTNGGVGFSDHQTLVNTIMTEMAANGFDVIFPIGGLTGSSYSATLEASLTVDPLAATQPWRIRFDADGTSVKVFAATSTQLDDDGNTVSDPERSGFQVGEIGNFTTYPQQETSVPSGNAPGS